MISVGLFAAPGWNLPNCSFVYAELNPMINIVYQYKAYVIYRMTYSKLKLVFETLLIRPRLLSASFDGTARIWSYARQTWTCITLDCTLGPKEYFLINLFCIKTKLIHRSNYFDV